MGVGLQIVTISAFVCKCHGKFQTGLINNHFANITVVAAILLPSLLLTYLSLYHFFYSTEFFHTRSSIAGHQKTKRNYNGYPAVDLRTRHCGYSFLPHLYIMKLSIWLDNCIFRKTSEKNDVAILQHVPYIYRCTRLVIKSQIENCLSLMENALAFKLQAHFTIKIQNQFSQSKICQSDENDERRHIFHVLWK